MTDTITLPRAVGLHIRNSLRGIVNASDDDCGEEKCRECAPVRVMREALAALDAALKEPEPEQKPEPVAFTRKEWSPDCGEYVEFRTVEEMKFYDRTDWTPLYAAPPQPDATREPATDAEIVIAGDEHARDPEYLLDFRDGFRAAEWFHGIKKEGK